MSVAKLTSYRRNVSGLYVCIALFATWVAGCAEVVLDEPIDPAMDKTSTEVPTATGEARIMGGVDENGFAATVLIETVAPDGAEGICTGTLVTPTTVLTAAHCVADLSAEDLTLRNGSARAVVVFDGDREVERVQIVDSVFHAEWNDSNLQQGVDLGMVYLGQPLSVEPAILDDMAPDVRAQSVGTIVGFGVDENGRAGRKKSTQMAVDEYLRQQFLLKSADQAHRSSCNGDSGGPLYFEAWGSRVLAGVASWGPPECEVDDSYYVAVFPHLKWIRENLQGPSTGVRQKVKYFGSKSCKDNWACLIDCADDSLCKDDCFEETSLDGQQQFMEVARCKQQNQCQDDACMNRSCRPVLEMCLGELPPDIDPQAPIEEEPPLGAEQPDPDAQPKPAQPDPNPPAGQAAGGICSDLIQCAMSCRDVDCIDQCLDMGTHSVERLSDSVWQCFANRCQPLDFQCFTEQCLPAVNDCFEP